MIKASSLQGFKTDEMQKFQAAMNLDNLVLASNAFKAAVLGALFMFTNDTAQEIFQRVTGQDWSVRFQIVTPPFWKRWFSSEVAKEDTSSGLVTLDRNKFVGEDLPALANTIAHEVCHAAGYSHPYPDIAGREQSVPYQIGDIVERIAREMLQPLPVSNAQGVANEVQAT